jgi:hypothetical protein
MLDAGSELQKSGISRFLWEEFLIFGEWTREGIDQGWALIPQTGKGILKNCFFWGTLM